VLGVILNRFGYNGKILRVNLNTEKTSIEKPKYVEYRRYFGGRALALHYLLQELPFGIDPFDSKNLIVISSSVVSGAPVPGFNKYTVAALSPLTGGFGEAEAGGYFSSELKKSGYDAIIIKGRASSPVYLLIRDGNPVIYDADKIWGKSTGDAQDIIRKRHKDNLIRVLQIGQAGENLVRFSCILNELKFVNGRCGLGAVMGSKNLKAVAVRGHQRVRVKDPDTVKHFVKFYRDNFKKNADCLSRFQLGTSNYFNNANIAGSLPTRNFHEGTFKTSITGEKMHETMVVGKEGCYACPNQCKRLVELKEPYNIDSKYGGPEFESLSALSSICCVDSLAAAAKGNELCNKYGLDTISTGATIAFAMECFENGLLTEQDTEGIKLSFGNADAMLHMIDNIAFRKGIGSILAEGVMRASKIIGKNSGKFAMHVKGLELAMHEPRAKFGVGLAYAISPTGADHLQHEHDGAFDPGLEGYSHDAEAPAFFMEQSYPLGILEPIPSLDLKPKKVRLFTYLQHWWSLFNSLGLCIFTTAPVRLYTVSQIVEIVKAITGWDVTLWELMKLGERGTTMARCLNILQGITKDLDILPERFFQPIKSGGFKGSKLPKNDFKNALISYYDMMGWNKETGVPTKGKLEELDIGWIGKIMSS
jgi:aldehyde:ferredoxin oxidoreductase